MAVPAPPTLADTGAGRASDRRKKSDASSASSVIHDVQNYVQQQKRVLNAFNCDMSSSTSVAHPVHIRRPECIYFVV